MNLKELVTGGAGEKQFLLGNEAAVRGLIEAGISIAATYPGTPSSEIGNVLSVLAKDANIYFEFSTNEKVAMEVAATAAAPIPTTLKNFFIISPHLNWFMRFHF